MQILLGILKPAVVNTVRHRIWEAQCILKSKLKFGAFVKLLRRKVLKCHKLKEEHNSIRCFLVSDVGVSTALLVDSQSGW